MNQIDWTRHPAEACTDLGADSDTTGDGGMIGRLLIAVALVFAALGIVHIIALIVT